MSDRNKQEIETMGYSKILELVLQGARARRAGWNGKGMWIEFASGAMLADGRGVSPFLMMRTADGKFVPWTVSQTDCTAWDWELIK